MNKKYAEFQKKTQIHNDYDLQYYGLGLSGESGEVANEIKKLRRDDDNILTDERKEKIITELGDTMWYITGICNHLGITIDDLLVNNMDKLQKRHGEKIDKL